jgi:glyoxylase I family protein
MLNLNALHHIAIICSDYQASRHFYTSILGLGVIRENFRAERNSYKLDLKLGEDYVVELFSFPDATQRPSFPEACGLRHLAFATEDLDQSVLDLSSHGVTTEPIRTDPFTGKRFTFFSDPDKLPLELYEN